MYTYIQICDATRRLYRFEKVYYTNIITAFITGKSIWSKHYRTQPQTMLIWRPTVMYHISIV